MEDRNLAREMLETQIPEQCRVALQKAVDFDIQEGDTFYDVLQKRYAKLEAGGGTANDTCRTHK